MMPTGCSLTGGVATRTVSGLVQLGTVRFLGMFLADPVDVPTEAVDYVSARLEVADPSCLKAYAKREKTRLEHQWEIARVHGYGGLRGGGDQAGEVGR